MTDPNPSFSRRAMLTAAFVGGSAAAAALSGAPAAQAAPASGKKQFQLTVLGTTDLHNNVFNWDYFKDVPYSDNAGNKIGIAQAATLIKAVRAERGAGNTLTIDSGDTIQGTPLAYYFAKVNPISETVKHPMALAMNAVGYDAVGLGNHEFNYGIPMLRTWEKQLDFPLLGANVHDAVTGQRAFTPYVLKRVKTENGWLTVGLVGFVTPGCALWDRDNVHGKLDFNGIVEEARTVIPEMKAAGADVVIVSSHSGATPGSSYGDALPFPENASTPARRGGPRDRCDPRRARPPGDPGTLRHQQGHRPAGAPDRTPEVGHARSRDRPAACQGPGPVERRVGALAPAGRQDRRGRPRRRQRRAGRARGDREVRQPGDRHLHGPAEHGDRLLGRLGSDRRDQLCPGEHHQGGAGQRARRRASRCCPSRRRFPGPWTSRPAR